MIASIARDNALAALYEALRTTNNLPLTGDLEAATEAMLKARDEINALASLAEHYENVIVNAAKDLESRA